MGQGRRLGLRTTLPNGSRGVALTFDDGPGPATEQLLDVLAEADVRATFFVTGAHLRARPAVAARIVADGHLLANHTWSHPQDVAGSTPRGDFDLLPRDEQARQMDDTTAEIVAVAGVPPRFFRGPAGRHFGTTTAELAAGRGMSITHWSVDTYDWRAPATFSPTFRDEIVARATVDAPPDSILLFHDGKASAEPEEVISSYRGHTVAAIEAVIAHYRAAGQVFCDPDGRRL
jgi:peptidoglycan-N-acetylglucosamine deacetylase